VIDPSFAGSRVLERCAEQGWTLETILLTHGHIDHTHDAAFLSRETAAKIMAHEKAAPLLGDPLFSGAAWLGMTVEPCAASRLAERRRRGAPGRTSPAGPAHARSQRGLHLPPGRRRLFHRRPPVLRRGGRWDLPGGDQRVLAESLNRLVASLADETILYPGHGPHTTLSREKDENPFLLEWL